MNHAQIAEILDRYWEGETTIVEERQLKDYFATGNIDERFREVAPLFLALNEAYLVKAPVHLGKGISPAPLHVVGFNVWKKYMAAAVFAGVAAIGGWMYFNNNNNITSSNTLVAVAVTPPPAATLQKQPEVLLAAIPKAHKSKNRASASLGHRASASLSHRASASLSHRASLSASAEPETYTEAEALQAAEEIKAALALVSRKLKKGKDDATKNLNKVEIMDHYFKQG